MRLHDLQPAPGATRKRTRKGRGIAAGQGKTAGRGTKGQGARAGGVKRPYFEGGQLPLVRRLPHLRGFTNIYREEFDVVNLDQLDKFEPNTAITPELLGERGLVAHTGRVKVLGRGDLTKALQVSAHAFSESARQKITAAGGSANVLPIAPRAHKVR